MKCICVVSLLALAFAAESQTNPISKVLSLLSELQQKVMKDGEAEQKQYERFAEWCEDEAVSTQYEIKDGKSNVEAFQATIEKTAADIADASSRIETLAKTIATNNADLQSASAIRAKENADFKVSDAELAETIDMLGRAIGIIGKNMKGTSLAQGAISDMTNALKTIVSASMFSTNDRSKVQEFLQNTQPDDDFLSRSAPEAAAYENHSGGILDTLEDMREKAETMRNEAQKAEMNSQHNFEMLAQDLKRSLAEDGDDRDAAAQAKRAASEANAEAAGNLKATQKSLANAESVLSTLSTDCQQKAADWETSTKSRGEELEALVNAKKIIGDMTGGAEGRAYGFLEVRAKMASRNDSSEEVLKVLKKVSHGATDFALTQLVQRVKIALATQSTDDVFAKVRGMISEMLEKLLNEAAEEASHKEYCDKELGESRAKIDDHNDTIDRLNAKIDKASATIEKLTASIAATEKQLADLLKQQATMDSMRADEKTEYESAKKDYEDGVEGLTMALKILREYYAENENEAALLQQPAVGVHSKASGEAGGIIGMLEVAQSDFSKMLADATVTENSAQSQYDKISQENQVTKAIKEQDLKYENKEKASLKKTVADVSNDRNAEQAELDAVLEYFDRLKPQCTTKPESYADRKARRESEIAGLKSALTILEGEGAESFLTMNRSH